MRIVIIGNGVAGIEAALTVRARESDWPITIVSEESDHFFSRTALLWVLAGQMSARDIEPYERDLYARMNFTRVRARATGIDTTNKLVRLGQDGSGGESSTLAYDRLLIACGSAPRRAPFPGAQLKGVGHFVTMQDLAWFEQELYGENSRHATPPRADAHLASSHADSPYYPRKAATVTRRAKPRAAAVVGGGLIGIEAVEVLHAAKIPTHFLIREEWFWPMAIDERESAWIAERMRDHGVDVHLNREAKALRGDDHGCLTRIETSDGNLDVDLAVVAIGVVPNTGWIKESTLQLDKAGGVVVDTQLRTSAPDVFAAGDCASVPWFDGSVRPEQLWYTARDQGRIAGRALLGDGATYQRGVFYNSAKLMDIEYTTAGLVNMHVPDERCWYFEERSKVRSTTRIVLSGDRIVGFNALGRRWDHSKIIEFIETRRPLDYVLDHLHEAAFDTEFVPPLRWPAEARREGLTGPTRNPKIKTETKVPF